MADDLIRLREALSFLLLPIPPEQEAEALAEADDVLADLGVPPSDRAQWLRNEHAVWREDGTASPALKRVVVAAIAAGDDEFGADLAASYFDLHANLTRQPLFGFDSASALLSHAGLMGYLAWVERLSAAQVARLVAARDPSLAVSWTLVGDILAAMRVRPSLDQDDVVALYERDAELEASTFADADDLTAIAQVADVAARLGVGPGFGEALQVLLPPEGGPFGPYLQMLHFQCVIAEFYDHALSAIYEFSPRGTIPEWLFAQYPPALAGAGNPFLNNAKSVDRLDRNWANSKKDAKIEQAHALVTVIEGLERLGFAARMELASWVRRLLARRIRLATGTEYVLPDALSVARLRRLLACVAAGESNTQGIIEQRVVDAVAEARHPSPTWIARGLGDSVNATNVSRRKLGDCDFQNADGGEVVAYEAHGGLLTQVYVAGHERGLRKSLEVRQAEWAENFGEDKEWTLQVVFVAHEIGLDVAELPEFDVDRVHVRVTAVTYADFLDGAEAGDERLRAAADRLIRAPMAERRTPDYARGRLLEMLS